MTRRDHLFWSESVMLVTAITPLAIAEETSWYWIATLGAVIVGWLTTVRRRRPLVSPATGQLLVVVAAGLLIYEYGWVPSTPSVLALSHFMILVCISKLITRRDYRDHAQLVILALLLLVVAAIVSGDLLFPIVLVVFLTVGMHALVRYQLDIEVIRVDQHNARAQVRSAPPRAHAVVDIAPSHARALARSSLLGAAVAIGVGAGIFVLCPRVGAGMFGEIESHAAGRVVAGLAEHINLRHTGPIHPSQQTIMRVWISYGDGSPVQVGHPFYFRGNVLDQYQRASPATGYIWRRVNRDDTQFRTCPLQPAPDGSMTAHMLRAVPPGHSQQTLLQRYHLEPQKDRCLFTCYPALEISSRDFEHVRRCVPNEVLLVNREPGKILCYEARSPVIVTSALAQALAADRNDAASPAVPRDAETSLQAPPRSPSFETAIASTAPADSRFGPEVLPPDPPIERQADILALVDRLTSDIGPLDVPANRLAFLHRLENHLRSRPFTYSTNPPQAPRRAEPITHFLFETRTGHCEFFASALAIFCQLKGVPARIVSGYATGDYNPVGDFYLVRGEHAHAWVEAYVPGMDWITLDPTPATGRGERAVALWRLEMRHYLDYLQFRWSNMVLAYNSDLRAEMIAQFVAWVRRPMQDERTLPGAIVAFIRELFGWRLRLSWHERLVYWVFALLVVALVLLSGYVVVAVTWRLAALWARRYPKPRPTAGLAAEADFYHQFCRRLNALGLRRRPDQTPAEFADGLANCTALMAEAPDLVGAYYAILFGQRPLAPDRRARIQAFLRRLRSLDDVQRQQLAALGAEMD